MKRIILLLGIGLLCSNLFAQGVKFEDLSLKQALERAKAEGKFVFVDLWATWCSPCMRMAEEVLPLKEVGDYCNGHFICIHLDVDKPEGNSVKKKYGVGGIPTFLILHADGTVRHRLQSARSADDFLEWLRCGVGETSCMFYLNRMVEQGQEMSVQNRLDYYKVLKDGGAQHEADSIREILFRELPLEKLTEATCWSFFSRESYESEYFRYVLEHRKNFRGKLGKECVDNYLFDGYLEYIQNLMFAEEVTPSLELLDGLTRELTQKGKDIVLGERMTKVLLAWEKEAKAFLVHDVPGIVEGAKDVIRVDYWHPYLHNPLVYVSKHVSDKERERIGQELLSLLFRKTDDRKTQLKYCEDLQNMGFPVSRK